MPSTRTAHGLSSLQVIRSTCRTNHLRSTIQGFKTLLVCGITHIFIFHIMMCKLLLKISVFMSMSCLPIVILSSDVPNLLKITFFQYILLLSYIMEIIPRLYDSFSFSSYTRFSATAVILAALRSRVLPCSRAH